MAVNFPILSFEQANPILAKLKYLSELRNQTQEVEQRRLANALTRQYAPQEKEQSILQNQIANAMAKNRLNAQPESIKGRLENTKLNNIALQITNSMNQGRLNVQPRQLQQDLLKGDYQNSILSNQNRYAPELSRQQLSGLLTRNAISNNILNNQPELLAQQLLHTTLSNQRSKNILESQPKKLYNENIILSGRAKYYEDLANQELQRRQNANEASRIKLSTLPQETAEHLQKTQNQNTILSDQVKASPKLLAEKVLQSQLRTLSDANKAKYEPEMSEQLLQKSKYGNQILGNEAKYSQKMLSEKLLNSQIENLRNINKAANEPLQSRAQLKNTILRNQNLEITNKYAAQNIQSQIAAHQMRDSSRQSVAENSALKEARARQIINSNEWDKTPPSAKNYQLAQLAGAGINSGEAIRELTHGKDMDQIMKEHGYNDTSKYPPLKYPATNANITQQNQRAVAGSEIQSLNKFIIPALAPYSRIIPYTHIPVQEAIDALKGIHDTDKRKRFLAAVALSQETALGRIKWYGGNVSVSARHDIINSSMTNITPLRARATPEEWIGAQKYIDEQLQQGFEESSKLYQVGGKPDITFNGGNNGNSPASKILAKTASFPKFKTEQAFHDWVNKNDSLTVNAYLKSIGAK